MRIPRHEVAARCRSPERSESRSFRSTAPCSSRPPIADPRDISMPNCRKSAALKSLQLGRIAKRHHAAALDDAAADAVARSGADDEAAERRQAQRERGENDHGAARVLRSDFQQEQDADHGELADRQCHDDAGQIRERPAKTPGAGKGLASAPTGQKESKTSTRCRSTPSSGANAIRSIRAGSSFAPATLAETISSVTSSRCGDQLAAPDTTPQRHATRALNISRLASNMHLSPPTWIDSSHTSSRR